MANFTVWYIDDDEGAQSLLVFNMPTLVAAWEAAIIALDDAHRPYTITKIEQDNLPT